MGAFVKHYGWTNVVILSCDDEFCTGYADELIKQQYQIMDMM